MACQHTVGNSRRCDFVLSSRSPSKCRFPCLLTACLPSSSNDYMQLFCFQGWIFWRLQLQFHFKFSRNVTVPGETPVIIITSRNSKRNCFCKTLMTLTITFLNLSGIYIVVIQKNPRAHKNKIGTLPPPPKKPKIPHPKTRNLMDMEGFPAERTLFSRRP